MKIGKVVHIECIYLVFKFITFGSLCMFFFGMSSLSATPKTDSSKPHTIKLDIIPLYSVLFDVRKQIRLGLEYQKNTNKKQFIGIHIDAGLYDDYSYYKYYDFFNQNGGFHYTRQDVKTYGFHLMPAWHYRFSRSVSLKRTQCFTGITADLNMFEKKIKTFNSQTFEKYRESNRQARLGLGLHLGMIYRIRKSFHMELKAIFIAGLITLQSHQDMKDIKPFKSVWFDDRQRFWFIPQINLSYDF